MLATDRELPVTGGVEKRAFVRGLFSAIAPRYDLLNHLLSLNFDRRWRRSAVAELAWERRPAGDYLDLCAGTMDLAAQLGNSPGFRGRILGIDFVRRMLELGRGKSLRATPVAADALLLPFANARFGGATVGFGVRNLADLDGGVGEAARVPKPGARLVVLEFTMPPRQPLRALYSLYFRLVLPLLGRLISKHRSAYTWLPASVLAFPDPGALVLRLRAAGFDPVRYRLLLGGICALHVGEKR